VCWRISRRRAYM